MDRRSKPPEYKVWLNMIQRCTNPRSTGYKTHGGRGIAVCERWRCTFDNFIADMGARPSAWHVLSRRDLSGNFEAANCSWVSKWAGPSNVISESKPARRSRRARVPNAPATEQVLDDNFSIMAEFGSLWWEILYGKKIVTIRQIKAARALLRWSQADLASASGLAKGTISHLEAADGCLTTRREASRKLCDAIEAAGVEFIDEKGGGQGVRLRSPKRAGK